MASAPSGPGHAAGLAGSPVHQGSPTWARLSGAPGLHPPGARAPAAPRAATVEHVPRRGPWLTALLGVKVLWTPQAAPRRPPAPLVRGNAFPRFRESARGSEEDRCPRLPDGGPQPLWGALAASLSAPQALAPP